MADRARRKRRRLSRSGEFERVYREGRSHASRHLVVYAFPRADDADSDPRLGVSVGRKVGGALERNRMKRLLREAFWASAEELRDGHDFVIVARPAAGELAGQGGEQAIEAELREVLTALASQLARRGPGHDHEVVPLAELLGARPKSLPEQALHAIALDGAAELAAHGHAEPRLRVGVLRAREGVDHEVPARMRATLAVDAFELAAAG